MELENLRLRRTTGMYFHCLPREVNKLKHDLDEKLIEKNNEIRELQDLDKKLIEKNNEIRDLGEELFDRNNAESYGRKRQRHEHTSRAFASDLSAQGGIAQKLSWQEMSGLYFRRVRMRICSKYGV